MSPARCSRSLLSLVAAYAVALQSFLLVVTAPVAGSGFAAPICAHTGNGTAPSPIGHGCDCTANCLAGCCGAPEPPRDTGIGFAPPPARGAVDPLDDVPLFHLRADSANRSRAPPG